MSKFPVASPNVTLRWPGMSMNISTSYFSVARPLSLATWGLSDRYTWLRQYKKRADSQPLRPLPLDADFNRKPMWSMLDKYFG